MDTADVDRQGVGIQVQAVPLTRWLLVSVVP